MPTKTGQQRPRGVHGSLTSQVTSDRQVNRSPKPERNRNRVASAKPAAAARRDNDRSKR
jgi:hypothetical protein